MLPLHGVRVLDLGAVLMAPYAGQWLADLGADVVKIETPEGDTTRHMGPGGQSGMGALFVGLNRNKRSVVLNLKTDAGRRALLKLAESADVLLHNNRPQKMAALGLDFAVLHKRNPRLIYACLHGFGEAGPYGGQPAYDDIIQGLCGLADLMAHQTGEPRYVPTVIADKTCGLIGAIAILAALTKRHNTGVGGYVEIPMFESMVAFTVVEHLYGKCFEPPRGKTHYPRLMASDRRPYATKDGYICALPYTDKHWRKLFEACDSTHFLDDPRFSSISARTENIAELYSALSKLMVTRTSAEWLEILAQLEIPCAPLKSIADLVDDPHLSQTGFFTTQPDETVGLLRFPGVPVLFDGDRPAISPPPQLGQHTKEVLQEAGLPADHIAQVLAASEVVSMARSTEPI